MTILCWGSNSTFLLVRPSFRGLVASCLLGRSLLEMLLGGGQTSTSFPHRKAIPLPLLAKPLQLSIYVYIYIHIYNIIHMYMYCVYVYMIIYVYMYLCSYVSMYVCMYVSMYLCMYLSIYQSIYLSNYRAKPGNVDQNNAKYMTDIPIPISSPSASSNQICNG
jgi:hypothetical protein